MCLYCLDSFAPNWAPARFSRRDMMRGAAVAGGAAASFPFGAARSAFAEKQTVPTPAEFKVAVKALVERSRSPELAAYRLFEINGPDLPWVDLGVEATKGQQVTFLLTGVMWIARKFDLRFSPGVVFHARTRGLRPMWSPGVDTGTMTATHDGRLEIARSAAQFSDEDAKLWTAEDEYRKQEAKIVGVALLWKGDAAAGLASLAAHGEVGGLIGTEIARLKRGRKLPEGWSDYFSLGGGAEVFGRAENGEIICESAGGASIIERVVPLSLASRPKLGWRWKIDQLPSAVAEDQPPFHDYLSIGVKFEDGQDLTYFWSAALPAGKVFRCPLAGWSKIETHMVVDSGTAGLGSWREHERDIAADYAAHIGGPAKAISHVWLLAITPFQRRRGACRYADIEIVTADRVARKL